MKISVFIGLSLDGYIAGDGGSLDFLNLYSDPGEDYGYAKFMESVDCLLMGRKTFEVIASFPEWPYQKKVFVITSNTNSLKEPHLQQVEPISGSPKDVVKYLKEKGYTHIYLDGGITISHFLKDNLVTDMTLSFLPHILGAGVQLFQAGLGEKKLQLQSSRAYPSGIVKNEYDLISDLKFIELES